MTSSDYNEIRERLLRVDADLVLAAAEADQELLDWSVEFALVGGGAAVVHGAPVTTQDIDIVHRRGP